MSKITYADKEYIYENAEIPAINKITDDDMNEIKTVVNANDDRLTTVEIVNDKVNGTVLYENATGTTGNIVVTKSPFIFKKIEIYAYKGTYTNIFTFCPNSTNNLITLAFDNLYGATDMQRAMKTFEVTATGFTKLYNTIQNQTASQVYGLTVENEIYVTKIIGYE